MFIEICNALVTIVRNLLIFSNHIVHSINVFLSDLINLHWSRLPSDLKMTEMPQLIFYYSNARKIPIAQYFCCHASKYFGLFLNNFQRPSFPHHPYNCGFHSHNLKNYIQSFLYKALFRSNRHQYPLID